MMNVDFLYNLQDALTQIILSFTKDPSIWWLVTPIIILWIVTEIYAGEYKKESFSFSGLLAGGISLSWVTIVSVRIFFLLGRDPVMEQEFIALVIFALYAVALIYFAFSHSISIRVARWVGRPSFVYFISILAVLWGQGVLPLNQLVLIDLAILYAIIDIIFAIIKHNFLGLSGDIEMVKKAGDQSKEE